MTTQQKAYAFLERAQHVVGIAASLFILVGGTYAAFQAVTGGFRPALQVDVDGLSQGLVRVQADVKTIKDRVEAMPRPADYAAQDQHLGRLDQKTDQLNDRLTKDEIDLRSTGAELSARVTRLEIGTDTRTRQPR